MTKKAAKIVVFLVIISLILVPLTACEGSQSPQGEQGTAGPPFTENESAIAQMVFPVPTNITEISLVEPDVVYAVADGIELTMDIYYPKQYGAKVPVVVYVHGGAFQGGDKRDGIVAGWMPEMVSRGYMVASINYRLVPQGGTFPFPVEDVKCAVRWLRGNAAKYRIDVNNIGVIGGSAGGYLVNMMGVCDASAGFDNSGGYLNQSSRVQAVVDLYGISDIAVQYETGRIEGPDGPVSQLIDNPDKFTEIATSASPINYVTPDDPPFLIIHGDKDTDVIPQQSEMLYSKLIEANVPATLVWVENGGHGFIPVGENPISPSFNEILKITADFFDRYLQAETASRTVPNYITPIQYEYSAIIEYDQTEWTYLIHISQQYDGTQPVPLVLALHPSTRDSALMANLTGFNTIADRENFIVVYPKSYNTEWDCGTRALLIQNVDETGFISYLIDNLCQIYNIDSNRIFATGMSSGGGMCYALASRLSDKIAAIASVSGAMFEDQLSEINPEEPLSVLHIHGTEDPVIPWQGGNSTDIKVFSSGTAVRVLSVPEIIKFWVDTLGCGVTPTIIQMPDNDPSDGTIVTIEEYSGGARETEVVLYAIENGGHSWPDKDNPMYESVLGKICHDFDASEIIWRFFKFHPREQ